MATRHERVRFGGEGERMAHIPTDPVCGMSVEPEHAAGSHAYHGETYYFCSQTCLDRFAAAPEHYIGAQATDAPAQSTSTPAHSPPSPRH